MNDSYEKKIGQNIRKLRTQKSITQETISAKMQLRGCDMTRSAYAKIEVGQRHIYPDELYLIKHILNVPWEDIFLDID